MSNRKPAGAPASASATNPAPPTDGLDEHILARYEILQKCGKGAYGHVFKAVDRTTNQVVALKKSFDAFRGSTDAQVRLRGGGKEGRGGALRAAPPFTHTLLPPSERTARSPTCPGCRVSGTMKTLSPCTRCCHPQTSGICTSCLSLWSPTCTT